MAMFGGAPTVAAADWVMHGGNPGHTSFAPDLRPPFARAWTAQLDGRGVFGPPVVAGGRLYVSTQDLQGRGTDVTAFDPRTGKRLWQTLAAGDEGQIAYGDGRLYVLGEVLSALDARTGARVWSREAEPGIPTPGPGVVIVPTGLAADGGIAVIDGATGAIRWATSFRNSNATPASDGRRVYATWACGRVVAMDIATGAVVWEAPCLVPAAGRIEAELDGDRIHVRGITVDDVLDIATGRALGRISSMAYGAYGDGEIYSVTGDITPSETNFQRFYPWAGQRLEA